MANTEKPAHRKAVFEARARVREGAAGREARVRKKRRKISILAGFGLSSILLGGVTGANLALDGAPVGAPVGAAVGAPVGAVVGAPVGAAGPSVAISLALRVPEPVPARSDAVQLALAETTGLQIALPPLDADPALGISAAGLAAGSETQRLVIGNVLAELSGTARSLPLPEAAEAALARLYEEPLDQEPLETAAGPEIQPAIQQAALPMPSVPDLSDVPDLNYAGQPPWQRFAVPVAAVGARPMIAVVLDDLGLNRPGTNRAIDLPAPLTLAFMTYAEGLPRMAARARRAGHELLLHMPMAPSDPAYDPGPNVLRAELAPAELLRRLEWGLGRFEGFVGVNNHMGSRFTASRAGMAPVMTALRARGLLFLDSMTSGASVGADMAGRAGVPFARRDVFLDNEWSDRAAIARQFAHLEAVARRNGSAVGIGHPHRATLDVLARWLPEARARGFAIVPVSAIVRHRRGLGALYVETSG